MYFSVEVSVESDPFQPLLVLLEELLRVGLPVSAQRFIPFRSLLLQSLYFLNVGSGGWLEIDFFMLNLQDCGKPSVQVIVIEVDPKLFGLVDWMLYFLN